MLGKRIAVALVLLPIGIAAIMAGGWWFILLMALLLGQASLEFVQLFEVGGLKPSRFIVVGGVILLIFSRALYGFENDAWLLAGLVFLSMVNHLTAYERGRDQSATDFAITLSGLFYIGLLGSYFMPMRNLPDGEWWILVV
ncbi:MAG: phosphatidate cytidylyltransferase, partial [Chloroflexota bacterium]